jgi:hypothetical protein
MTYTSTRFLFSSLEGAVEALILVLEDARTTSSEYSFGGLSAEQIYASGLSLVGEIDAVADLLGGIEGATRYDD